MLHAPSATPSAVSLEPLSLDLGAYFQRIGYAGPREATLATLCGIMRAHVETIPFENLDVLLGRPIALEPELIFRKFIDEQRGGYCFEHNTLLLHVLEALGYSVRPLSARARVQRPRDSTPPRTHLLLRVEIENVSWLADVGVGGLSPTAPLKLESDIAQATPHEPRRLVREGEWSGFERRGPSGRIFHQAYFAETWHDVCEFTLDEMPLIDRVVANWYTSAHPQSHFKDRLMAARATPAGRITLSNRELTVRDRTGHAETRRLESPGALLAALDASFGLRFPAGTRFECRGLEW
jgi:N-hydroxyarylamine O-acetyltransferase